MIQNKRHVSESLNERHREIESLIEERGNREREREREGIN
jgi:hypothetical protein